MSKNNIIKGVFCDIANTVIDIMGNIDYEVLTILEEYERQEKKIHLWTSGNKEDVKRKFPVEIKNRWSVLSKYDFSGKKVEIMIDDESEEEIFAAYGIKCEQYINVIPKILRKYL